jgi:DmsE family decaheme c-type cytochrome
MAIFSGQLRVLLALAGLLVGAGAWGQPAATTAPASAPAAAAPASGGAEGAPERAKAPLPPRGQYSEKGADTCLECHDDVTPGYSGAAIFNGKHAHRNDKRAPFGPGGLQCEACHGPGARHARSRNPDAINSLKAGSTQTAAERNQACLTCHEGGARIGWHSGAHERNNVACGDCHRIHQDHDPVLAKSSEPDVCFTCHRQKRADFQKTSAHPVRFGLMACSDCHSAHGGTSNTAMLVKPTLNQTCFSCHADKRGPKLWEHAPVTESCAFCHSAHGSVRDALLVKSPPLLCQECHAPADHPSIPRTSQSLPGGSAGGSIFLVAGGCTNCHSQVHGSNHPAGAKLMR